MPDRKATDILLFVVHRRRLRSVTLSLAWLGIALAFGHLLRDASHPRTWWLAGFLAAAALLAFLLAGVHWLLPRQRQARVSGLSGPLVIVAAVVLVAARAAHETGLLLILGGVLIAVAGLAPDGRDDTPRAPAGGAT